MTQPAVVLASKSPRRAWLLRCAGVDFNVIVAGVDETVRPGEEPAAYTERVAREKCSAVARLVPGRVVVAADTSVVLEGTVLGKPADADDACRMLRALAGRSHRVLTAVAVGRDRHQVARVVETEVGFRALTDDEIHRYVATGEPMDKAGAYGIQGDGGALVAQVRGSYTAVVGLPVEETLALVREVAGHAG